MAIINAKEVKFLEYRA